MVLLVVLVSGLGYSQEYSKVIVLPTITKKERDSLKKIAAQPIDLAAAEEELIKLINDYRVENGLNKLERHPLLDSAARYQATYMSKIGESTHQNSTKDMETSTKRVTKFMGKTSKFIAENSGNFSIYMSCVRENITVSERNFNGWRDSHYHNQILLSNEVNHIGLSLVRDGDRIYTVMDVVK